MALAIPSSSHSKPYLFNSGHLVTDPLSSSVPMISVMSYQYPPLPPLSNEMDMAHSGYVPSYTVPSQQQLSSLGMANVHDAPLPSQDHSMGIKGPFSTPSATPLHPPETDAQQQQMGTSGEKKRNKLGYHRTSVACGHCRRRKIRCIPSPSDLQGRCINCIRLKKECSFYPVDQPPPDDSRAKQASRSSAGPKGSSASLSPAASTSNPAERPKPSKKPFSPSSAQVTPVTAPTVTEAPRNEGFPPDMRVSLPSSTNLPAFEMGNQSVPTWVSADSSQSPTSKTAEPNPTWRSYPAESPMSTQFSPFSVSPASAGWASGSSEPPSREDMAWAQYAPPVRSMSYGGEPMPGQHTPQYHLMAPSRQYERRSSTLSDVYTPAMDGMVPGFEAGTSTSMDTTVPLSAGAVPPTGFETWEQPHTQANYTFPRSSEAYGAWMYGERGRGPQLQAVDPSQQLADNGTTAGIYQNR
ncbi:hypothetical protein CEP54_012527 [Fusarium duplospermum]|uniref:Zn(2)-C6 fungal-type domain-containing protein n=1 Tax=Fusarium duplospermum TaxID=1325734 RepID=A0A428P898_9HYPO|nr:hypothetical protein CEP54_012527 [Fusarium duplospermum]